MERKRKKAGKGETAIEARKRELEAREAKVREQQRRLESVISSAPKIAEERARRQREEVTRSTGKARLLHATTLLDDRYAITDGRARPRSLRSERRRAQFMFTALLVGFLLLIIWIVSLLPW